MTDPSARFHEFTLDEAVAIAYRNDPGENVPSVSRVLVAECNRLYRQLAAAEAQLPALLAIAEASEWQPIETCPYNQIVLLWCPESSPWADTAWKGRRVGGDSRNCGYDEGFSIATPFPHMESGWSKQVWCSIEQPKFWPTHWMPLPKAPTVRLVREVE